MDRPYVTVQVRHFGTASYADLAPVLDALKAQYGSAGARVTAPDGSGRGGGFSVPLDIVFEVAERVGPVAAWVFKDLIHEMTTDAYRGVRQAIVDFRERHRKPELGGWVMPFSIIVGGLRFVVEPPLTADELAFALNTAHALADTLPDEKVGNPKGPGGHYYAWDAAARTWTGPHHP